MGRLEPNSQRTYSQEAEGVESETELDGDRGKTECEPAGVSSQPDVCACSSTLHGSSPVG
jgi:hypothetical protein